jgi:hypothetical protein
MDTFWSNPKTWATEKIVINRDDIMLKYHDSVKPESLFIPTITETPLTFALSTFTYERADQITKIITYIEINNPDIFYTNIKH